MATSIESSRPEQSLAYLEFAVKQSIGWTNILPLSRIWKRSGPLRPTYEKVPQREVGDIDVTLTFGDESPYTYPGTPEGGIILHWVMTVVFICLTAAFESIRKGMSFTGDLLVYGHFFIEGEPAVKTPLREFWATSS